MVLIVIVVVIVGTPTTTTITTTTTRRFLSFLLNSHYLFGQSILAQKITLHLRPDFRGRVISFEPGLGQEHLPVSFHWHESARC